MDIESLDNESDVQYSRKLIRDYIPYDAVGTFVENHLQNELLTMYGEVVNGIANDVALTYNTYAIIVDSGRENGKLSFGIYEIIPFDDLTILTS